MKKFFTLCAAAMVACAANAVDNGSAKVEYSAQWATVKMTTELPFSFDQYVGYKVELADIEGEPDANGVYFNILIESVETHKTNPSWAPDTEIDESDCIFYDNVRETSGTFEGEIKNRMADKGCTAGVRTFALQYTNNQTMSVVIKAVYLQTPDGEWVRQSIDPVVDSWTNTVVTILEDEEPGEEPGEEPQPEEPSVKLLWTNETGEAIPAWGGTFRFCNEEHMTGEEIYAFSMEDWALIKEGTIYVGVELTDAANIRVCDGWWSTTYGGAEHNCIDCVETAEDGTTCLVLNIKEDGNMYDAIDEKHLLFTGDAYTITSISAVASGNAISDVKAENNVKVIFNVAGQKMDAAKGLSIVNGKVIMVK